jgi:hypothetical protein
LDQYKIRADEYQLDCYVSPIDREISPAHFFWSPRKRERRERLTTAGELRDNAMASDTRGGGCHFLSVSSLVDVASAAEGPAPAPASDASMDGPAVAVAALSLPLIVFGYDF